MPHPTDQLEAYFAGDHTDEQLRAIEAWLHQAPANARAFMDELRFRELVGQRIRERADDTTTVLAELALLEDAAEVQDSPVSFRAFLDEQQQETARKRWLKTRLYLGSALAAVLVLGITLGLVISALNAPPQTAQTTSTTPPTPPNTPKPAESAQPIPRDTEPTSNLIVATLTAERDAVWDRQPAERALARGSQLHPGARLTLTAGFAEITTARGAIAILEAPATIELTDSDNALHLHTGKLVGICETDSSKGFVVRTPHMDVTDIGTRFGVDASQPQISEVYVFEGEVEVASVSAESTANPKRLLAGESAMASSSSDSIIRINYSTATFAAFMPQPMRLPSTGAGLSIGQVDPAWSIVAIDGKPLESPIRPNVFADEHHVSATSRPGVAHWIVWARQGDAARDDVTCLFETRIQLPEDLNPDDARINLHYAVDNQLVAIVVNGRRLANNQSKQGYEMLPYSIDTHLVPGENIIGFEVYDIRRSSANVNHVGLQLAWELESGKPALFESLKPKP